MEIHRIERSLWPMRQLFNSFYSLHLTRMFSGTAGHWAKAGRPLPGNTRKKERDREWSFFSFELQLFTSRSLPLSCKREYTLFFSLHAHEGRRMGRGEWRTNSLTDCPIHASNANSMVGQVKLACVLSSNGKERSCKEREKREEQEPAWKKKSANCTWHLIGEMKGALWWNLFSLLVRVGEREREREKEREKGKNPPDWPTSGSHGDKVDKALCVSMHQSWHAWVTVVRLWSRMRFFTAKQ